MISLPPDFQFPVNETGQNDSPSSLPSPLQKGRGTGPGPAPRARQDFATLLLEKAVLPHCRENGLPLAVMPGVRRAITPELKLAGDGVGWTDLTFLLNLCAAYPENRFMA